MARKTLKRKYGVVIILDALGASKYSEKQIKQFLSSRQALNKILIDQADYIASRGSKVTKRRPRKPRIFTFGDTIIITIELSSKKFVRGDIFSVVVLLQNYLYYSLDHGIMFRGAFSIGSYIEDSESNTVMGEAVSDAASWYGLSEWMGIASTPKTNNTLEYLFEEYDLDNPMFIQSYNVPLKGGTAEYLYTVSWAGRFFDETDEVVAKGKPPNKKFLDQLKKFSIPLGAERKFDNTKRYFKFIQEKIAKKTINMNE